MTFNWYIHDHLNEQNTDIQFTKENQISFLDCLVSQDNDEMQTKMYRKLTDTVKLVINELSYSPDCSQIHDC